jgi:hypothetical protein
VIAPAETVPFWFRRVVSALLSVEFNVTEKLVPLVISTLLVVSV